jgi:NAD(P)-dependent dehydrogenase (short-subunit alcohol dehydrogenase family)
MTSPFADKVAIITGGASGIGLAAARRLSEEGAAVAINDLDADRVRAAVLALGGAAIAIPGDASSPEVARNRTAEVIAMLGRVDILINSAGIFYRGPAEKIATNDWRRVMAVDLDGAFFWAQAVAAQSMLANRSGAIVNVASTAGLNAGPGAAPYVAAKHGVVGLTKALAVEWGPFGVRVNALCPGITETEMVAHSWKGQDEAYAERLARIPTGRAATPDEQAEAILFMASPLSGSVNGLIMNVDGGNLALSSGYSVIHPLKK